MKRFLNTLTFSVFFLCLNAQERYLEEITDSVYIDTFTYAKKDTQELQLDVFAPAFDNEFNRPVYIYLHAGGFCGGVRNAKHIQDYCKKIAQHGYVAVSISYRLTRKDTKTGFGCNCPASEKLKTLDAAVEDLQDATFFLIQQREHLGIDPQKIIISGSSAGAETTLNAAYEPPYCYGLDSGPISYAGVVSFVGAIPDINRIYDESAIPSMLFHGTCDDFLPYRNASHHYCNESDSGYLMLYGSYAIAEKLRELGKPYWLHTSCGYNHELTGSAMTDYFDEIIEFCYRFVLNDSRDQIHTIIKGDHTCEYPAFNFCKE